MAEQSKPYIMIGIEPQGRHSPWEVVQYLPAGGRVVIASFNPLPGPLLSDSAEWQASMWARKLVETFPEGIDHRSKYNLVNGQWERRPE